MSETVSIARFSDLKACFQSLGSRLSDAQLLELADLYHELLRSRRPGRRLVRWRLDERRSDAAKACAEG